MTADITKCCGERSGVYDSRVSAKGFVRRRRSCKKCGRRWTTAEIPEPDADRIKALLTVIDEAKELLALFPRASRER